METSAKDNTNVDECFTSLIEKIVDTLRVEETPKGGEKVNINKAAQPAKKKRCTLL